MIWIVRAVCIPQVGTIFQQILGVFFALVHRLTFSMSTVPNMFGAWQRMYKLVHNEGCTCLRWQWWWGGGTDAVHASQCGVNNSDHHHDATTMTTKTITWPPPFSFPMCSSAHTSDHHHGTMTTALSITQPAPTTTMVTPSISNAQQHPHCR